MHGMTARFSESGISLFSGFGGSAKRLNNGIGE